MSVTDPLKAHEQLGGKIRVSGRAAVTPDSLQVFYTPGVAAVSRRLSTHPDEAPRYVAARRAVAVVSDGSAVLGLGNVGPAAALPVMEGKAMLFADLAGVDAWPIVLSTQDPDEIVAAVKAIAPGFGGINLEDIAAPQCFDIERRLQAELNIPVVHDDQHATAIVVLAGLINALKIVDKSLETVRVVINGAGAAGSAIARLLRAAGAVNVMVLDSQGSLSLDRHDLKGEKRAIAELTGLSQALDLTTAVQAADVLIGVSVGGAFTPAMVQSMAARPIVFALANPNPEILPELALTAGAAVVASGRSDFANQINNVLVFPGLFKGLIEAGKLQLTNDDKVRVAKALADLVKAPRAEEIIPSVFDKRVVDAVAGAVSGVQ